MPAAAVSERPSSVLPSPVPAKKNHQSLAGPVVFGFELRHGGRARCCALAPLQGCSGVGELRFDAKQVLGAFTAAWQ